MHCEELQFCNTNAKLDFTNQIMAREKKKTCILHVKGKEIT